MTALIVILNLVLFVGVFVGAFLSLAYLAQKTIGYFDGARALVFTPGDMVSRNRFRVLTMLLYVGFALVSGIFFLALGQAAWSTFILAPSIGAALGLAASFKLNADRLKPSDWK